MLKLNNIKLNLQKKFVTLLVLSIIFIQLKINPVFAMERIQEIGKAIAPFRAFTLTTFQFIRNNREALQNIADYLNAPIKEL